MASDVRFYTFTVGTGLVEDADTAASQPVEPSPEYTAYVGAQDAARALGSAMSWRDGAPPVRIRVETNLATGDFTIGTV